MSDKPHLKLIRCHRNVGTRDALSRALEEGKAERITVGPLRGCIRLTKGIKRPFPIYRKPSGATWVLEFVLCIRIRLE